jgi:hypothetical protein
MRPEIAETLSHTNDFVSFTERALALCEPYGPVHALRVVHNRGAARVACFIELESPKQQPALARALGGRTAAGGVCLDVPVRRDFARRAVPHAA